jgi:WD40 repeat protein
MVQCVAASRLANVALSGSQDGRVVLWDLSSGRKVREFAGSKFGIGSLTFSPDGKQVLAGLNWNATAILWDCASANIIHTFRSPDDGVGSQTGAVAFSEDGTQIATGQQCGPIRIWECGTWRLVRTLRDTQRAHKG